jgi:MFS family permease
LLWWAFWLFSIQKAVGGQSEATESETDAQPSALATLRDDFVVGIGAIAKRPPLVAINLSIAIFYLTAGAFGALYTLFMLRELGLTPSAMGLIISVGGASALVGSVMALPLAKRVGFGPALILGFAIAMFGMVMLIPAAIFAGKGWAPLFMVAQQALGDAGFMIFSILSTSLSQKLLPENEIARANGFGQVVSGITMTVSILCAGAIAEVFGVKETVAWAAGLGTLGLLPLLTPTLWRLRDEPEEGGAIGRENVVSERP